ncbi:hypothetical protein [Sphingomonas sp. Leaf4]|uniref:hypothetical protein n=1 Tax=Sphingomonas sp. Leaf4 TaxID=2876553 RepID=UPI001E5D29B7|nr:hypothetical protein [Sphingomonas sp. Leaf4]
MIAALSIALLALASPTGNGPSSGDLAKAIHRFTKAKVSITDIRHLSCRQIAEDTTEARCVWQQRHNGRWRRYAGYLALDRSGWLLIDTPVRAAARR